MRAILVPLDGSELARRALPFATTLALRTGRTLLLLRAFSTMRSVTEAGDLEIEREMAAELDEDARAARSGGVAVETIVVNDEPASAILKAVAAHDAGLLVMSTHGRSGLGRWLYGSIADEVLRSSPVPVLLVPPAGLPAWKPERKVTILVPLDGSPEAEAVLEPVGMLADVLDVSLFLLRIVPFSQFGAYAEGFAYADAATTERELSLAQTYLDGVAARLRTEGRPVDVRAAYGSAFLDVATIAREVGAQVVAMATHGRGGVTRALLGSVATSTMRRADVPLLLIRPDLIGQEATTELPDSVVAPAVAATLTVSLDELDLLVQAVGDRFHNQPVDPRQAESTRRLLEKLRAARGAPAAPVPR